MAHMLDETTGQHAIAYVGETPWHGYGTIMQENQSIEDWATAARMDWSAIKVPSGYRVGDEWKQEPGRFAVIRDDTFARLGTFTDRYKIVQPIQILEFFRDFILTDDRFQLETAGCLKGGQVIWALARFKNSLSVMGEEHAPYVMLTTSFDGTLATTAQATMIRVVCNNTITASLWSKDAATIKVRHNVNWNEKAAARAHEQLEQVAATYSQYSDLAEALAMQRMSRAQTTEFFANLLGAEEGEDENGESKVSTRKSNMIDALIASYETTEKEGTEKGNAWTAFNAVTRYVDHDRATRRTNGETEIDSRMSSAFFGSGQLLKVRAKELLLAA